MAETITFWAVGTGAEVGRWTRAGNGSISASPGIVGEFLTAGLRWAEPDELWATYSRWGSGRYVSALYPDGEGSGDDLDFEGKSARRASRALSHAEQASSRPGTPAGIMEGVVDTFAFQSHGDSGLISLIPRDPESLAVEGGDPADELHVTVAYLGKLDEALDANRATSGTAAQAIARDIAPFAATVTEVGMLGHDEPPAMVLFLDAPGAVQAREIFEGSVPEDLAPKAYTYPDYKPHLTLGYGLEPGDFEHLVGTEIVLDKVAYAWGDDVTELPLSDPQGVTTEAFPVKHNPTNGQFLPASGVPGGPTAKDLDKANADDEDTDAWYAEGDEPPVITPIDSVEIGEGWDYRDGKWFDANGDLIGVSENGEEDGDIKWKPGFTPPLTEEAIRYITGGKKGKADFMATASSFPIRHDPRNGRFMPGPTVDAVVDEIRSALDSGLEIAAAGGEDGVLDAVNAEMDDIDPAVFDDQDAVDLWDTPEFRETVADAEQAVAGGQGEVAQAVTEVEGRGNLVERAGYRGPGVVEFVLARWQHKSQDPDPHQHQEQDRER